MKPVKIIEQAKADIIEVSGPTLRPGHMLVKMKLLLRIQWTGNQLIAGLC